MRERLDLRGRTAQRRGGSGENWEVHPSLFLLYCLEIVQVVRDEIRVSKYPIQSGELRMS